MMTKDVHIQVSGTIIRSHYEGDIHVIDKVVVDSISFVSDEKPETSEARR